MPFYNNIRYIEKAIKSVLNSIINPDKVEIILVDDGSNDGSVQIAQHYTDKYDFVKLLVNENNLGPAKALKRALQFSTGEIIIFTAADDITFKNRVREVTNIFQKFEDVGVVISEAEIINENDQQTGEYYCLPASINVDNAFLYQLKRNYCLGATMAIRNRQDLFVKEDFLELIDDYQIGLDFMLEGMKIYPLKKVLLQYRVHSQSVSARKKELHLKTLSTLKQYDSKKFEWILNLGNSQEEVYLALGIFELFKGNEAEAENYLNKINTKENSLEEQSLIEYYFYQGIIKNNDGKKEEAFNHWNEIIQLQPDNFVVLNNLGALIVHKDQEKAKKLIEKACNVNPNYIDSSTNLNIISNNIEGELFITQRLLSNNLIKKEKYLEEYGTMGNEKKLKTVFKEVLEINETEVVDELTYNTISQWDSIAHMALVAEIEEQFNIMLDTDDVLDMSSFAKVKEILSKYDIKF